MLLRWSYVEQSFPDINSAEFHDIKGLEGYTMSDEVLKWSVLLQKMFDAMLLMLTLFIKKNDDIKTR